MKIQRYWCAREEKYPHYFPVDKKKCPVYDYKCICCDVVRDRLHGQSCA